MKGDIWQPAGSTPKPFIDLLPLTITRQECLGLKGRVGYHKPELGLANFREYLSDLL